MSHRHFESWSTIPQAERDNYAATVGQLAHDLDAGLQIFAELGRGEPASEPASAALGAMPYVAKDMLAAPGHEPGCGFAKPRKGLVQGRSAHILQRLDANGGTRVGFTNMTTLAYEPSGYNAERPFPVNPWNPEFATGGSSSGSAVAIAAGAAVVAVGSDTGGSVRIPASGCGVTGWKPTFGRIALDGAMALAPSFDTLGLLAREAADIVAVASLVGPELADPRLTSPPARVMLLGDLLGQAEPSVRRACQDALDALESAGLRLERRNGRTAIDVLDPPTLTLMQAECARTHRPLLESGNLDPLLAKRLTQGRDIGDEDLARLRRTRLRLQREFLDEYLPEGTCLALPVLAIRTPPLAETTPASPTFSPRTLYALSRNTRFANYLGLPALSLPAGFDDRGLPVGLQLLGRPDADAALLAAATAMQRLTDWHGRVPPACLELLLGAPGLLAA